MTPPCQLHGCSVLVTRPASQAARLCELITAASGNPIAFPTLEIKATEPDAATRARCAEHWDVLLFVSRNAVEFGLRLLPSAPSPSTGSARPLIAAVGRATATALQENGRPPDLVPEQGFDSEALLALPALQGIRGRRVLIVRGVGGRPLLGDTLAQRGAEVAYAEVYRRALPEVDIHPHLSAWQQQLDFITATSDEVLQNLCRMVGDAHQGWLRSVPLVVMSERGGATAMQLGFRTVAVAGETSDTGIIEALCRLALNQGRAH